MIINLTFDQPTNTLPSGFVASLNAAAQFLESIFTNPITINIDVGYGEINGQNLLSGALGESETFFNSYSYSAIRSALVANAASAAQLSAVSALPASDPTPGGNGNYWVATAEAKALGLMGASSAVDGFVGFASQGVSFTYNTTNGGSVASNTYDFFGVAVHELTEVMGRDLFVGSQDNQGIGANSYTPYDLFHYSGNGVRDFLGTTAGYFSADGGATDLGDFNTNPSGDFGDWASSVGPNSFLAFSNKGVANPVTANDLEAMNVLGYGEALIAPGTLGLIGDFNADGNSDILWQSANLTPTTWTMNGTTITNATNLQMPTAGWHIFAAGDFNNDGHSDILWQNTDGTPAIWEMNGTTIVGSAILQKPTAGWQPIATGDFNNDSHADILWQNTDGAAAIWEMNGTTIIGSAILQKPTAGWQVVATGDFNGDHHADIVWQNTDGTPAIWEMNGTTIIGSAILQKPTAGWHVVATADVNGDGHADILWQNTDGTPAIWEMNGTNIIGAAVLPNPGSSWKLLGGGNFSGPGDQDLLFVNTSTDQVQIWLMNGTQVSSMQAPHNGTSNASSLATPLSATPVLSEEDGYFPATLATGSSSSAGVASLGDLPSSSGGSLFNKSVFT